MLPLPYVQFEAEKGDMLLYERPVYNEKLQQAIDLEGREGRAPCGQGAAADFLGGQILCRFYRVVIRSGCCVVDRAARNWPVTVWQNTSPYDTRAADFQPQ